MCQLAWIPVGKANGISFGHKEATLKYSLSGLGDKEKLKFGGAGQWDSRLEQEFSQKTSRLCLGHTGGIWGDPGKFLSRMNKFLPKILVSCSWNYKLPECRTPRLGLPGLIKDLPTCIISWTALQASSLLAAMVTSFLAAGPRARTTRAGKSVL